MSVRFCLCTCIDYVLCKTLFWQGCIVLYCGNCTLLHRNVVTGPEDGMITEMPTVVLDFFLLSEFMTTIQYTAINKKVLSGGHKGDNNFDFYKSQSYLFRLFYLFGNIISSVEVVRDSGIFRLISTVYEHF